MAIEFTWKILSVDSNLKTMVIEYSFNGMTTSLNINQPDAGVDVGNWISQFAPIQMWEQASKEYETVSVGMSGTVVKTDETEGSGDSELSNVVGSWNEEYLRAMIYQVLEEIRESEV